MRRSIAAIGRTLVTLGLLILLFVSYELWGTGIFTARAQASLKKDFHKSLAAIQHDNPVVTPGTGTTPPTTINPDLQVAPAEGEPLAEIDIPKINVKWVVVEGVQLTDLAKGPGHYPGTPLPGQFGNAAIAGHRTTHGAPFYNADQLAKGDRIKVTTRAGTFVYAVYKTPYAVQPTDYAEVGPPPPGQPSIQLTLTTCNPKYSAAERLIVKAKLVPKQSNKAVAPPKVHKGRVIKAPPRAQLETNLKGQANSIKPTYLWGFIVLLVGCLWWWAFRRWRHPLTWGVGVIPFFVVLFPFFVYLERALPNGY